MGRPAAYLHVEGFESYGALDFDKAEVRKAMRRAGGEVQRAARALVKTAGVSKPGDNPGKQTGALGRGIRYRVSRSGFMVKVAPNKSAGMAEFYPAYLHYGVKAGARVRGRPGLKRRARGARADLVERRKSGGWRIEPRNNYMADALADRSGRVKSLLSQALAAALT